MYISVPEHVSGQRRVEHHEPANTQGSTCSPEKMRVKVGDAKGTCSHTARQRAAFVVGNLMNCSAQVIEMKHLSIKKDAGRTNNKKNWELQVLIKQQVRDNASEQMWKQTEDNQEENMEELWVAKCKPRARASF